MTITLTERFEILTRDGFTCQYCGRQAPETELEVDHVQPRSQGGTDDRRNLVTTCRDCNRGKGDKAARPPQRSRGLPGRFFHSFDRRSGRIQRQGMFKEDLGDGYFVVVQFDWIFGTPDCYGMQVVHISRIAREGWALYETDEEMRWAWRYGGRWIPDRRPSETAARTIDLREVVIPGGNS